MSIIVPKGIVVHSMAEYLNIDGNPVYAKDFLKSINLSVHGFVRPDGSYDKMIETPNRASHAGKSVHEPYSWLNSHYIGFELLVKGVHDYASFVKAIETPGTYSEEQFKMAVDICKYWMKTYKFGADRVVRHSDVSGDDVRGKGKGKVDPGSAWDWNRFKNELVS